MSTPAWAVRVGSTSPTPKRLRRSLGIALGSTPSMHAVQIIGLLVNSAEQLDLFAVFTMYQALCFSDFAARPGSKIDLVDDIMGV